MTMPLRRGVHAALEGEADRLIRESLKGVTKHSEKADILTAWKEAERHRREVYVGTGIPDPANRRGIFHRSTNPARPDLNSREGTAMFAERGLAFRGLRNFLEGQRLATTLLEDHFDKPGAES